MMRIKTAMFTACSTINFINLGIERKEFSFEEFLQEM